MTTVFAAAPVAPTTRSSRSWRPTSGTGRSPRSFVPRAAVRDPLVVSANPGCAMHLAAAGLDVRHPADLLAEALDA